MYEMKMSGDTINLLKSMLEITKSVESIPKDGNNEEYEYVTERAVVGTMRTKLADKNIVLIPNVVSTSERNVSNTTIVKVVMSFTFVDTETGGSITTYFQGEGEDALDKGIYKAMTGCQKYALLKTFQIPTGDDPEKSNNVDKSNFVEVDPNQSEETKNSTNSIQNTEKEIDPTRALAMYHSATNKEELMKILSKYGYKSTYKVKEKHYDIISKELKVLA